MKPIKLLIALIALMAPLSAHAKERENGGRQASLTVLVTLDADAGPAAKARVLRAAGRAVARGDAMLLVNRLEIDRTVCVQLADTAAIAALKLELGRYESTVSAVASCRSGD